MSSDIASSKESAQFIYKGTQVYILNYTNSSTTVFADSRSHLAGVMFKTDQMKMPAAGFPR